MYISRIIIKNWRNFSNADVELRNTVFIMGPNASGKSNFLDIIRFMRDIVNPRGGGLQQAVSARGGLKKIRCLAGRRGAGIELGFELKEHLKDAEISWKYSLGVITEARGKRRFLVKHEHVWRKGVQVLDRPNVEDKSDPDRLTETFLELTNSNQAFRELSEFFQKTLYLHLVPQLLKHSEMFVSKQVESDPFGQGFLEQISSTKNKMRERRLGKIEAILKSVIPHIQELRFRKDDVTGRPHFEMRYLHWRPNAGWQREDQLSDGTLRLIALLWTLMASDNLILLEEPELSLHEKIVEQIPRIIGEARRFRRKVGQVFISTHSPSLLSDTSISGTFLILNPGSPGESTTIDLPTEQDLQAMKAGMSAADILLPKTAALVREI